MNGMKIIQALAAFAVVLAAAVSGQAQTYAFPERPAGTKGGIEGAFLRIEMTYFGSSLSTNYHGWFFTKDGRFSKAPKGGFDFTAFAAAPEATKKTEGSYWIADGKITFAWAGGGKPAVHEFSTKDDDLVWSGLQSTRVEGFRKGWRLDGEYSGGASVGGGTIASSSTITFAKDGTFRRGSVTSVNSTTQNSTVSGGGQSETRGMYEFDGHTLTLAHANGETKRFTVFAFGDKDAAGRPEHIYRDGTMMKRR
jgi:hypothetical protein